MEKQIRLFHVEYFRVIRDIFSICLQQNKRIVLTGEDQDCVQIFKHLDDKEVDVVLINLDKDGLNEADVICGIDICKEIRDRYPEIKLIVHSFHESTGVISKLMNAGVDGFISKDMGYEELLEVIYTVESGRKFLNTGIWQNYENTKDFLSGAADTLIPVNGVFTKREIEVLRLLSQGMSTKKISSVLYISKKTVETHRKNLVTKSGESNTAGLISYAHKHGYL